MDTMQSVIMRMVVENTKYTPDTEKEKVIAEMSRPLEKGLLYPRFTLLAAGPFDNSKKSLQLALLYKPSPYKAGTLLGTWKTPLKEFTPERLVEFLKKSEEKVNDIGKAMFKGSGTVVPLTFNNGVDPVFFGEATPVKFEDIPREDLDR